MRKVKIGVNNKLKGSYGETILNKGKAPIIRINVKKHRGNKAELADTIKHELMHVKHPNMKEKAVQKKTKVASGEQAKLIARLKTLNYKVGAFKRKLKTAARFETEPGALINEAKTMSRERLALMGLV